MRMRQLFTFNQSSNQQPTEIERTRIVLFFVLKNETLKLTSDKEIARQ